MVALIIFQFVVIAALLYEVWNSSRDFTEMSGHARKALEGWRKEIESHNNTLQLALQVNEQARKALDLAKDGRP